MRPRHLGLLITKDDDEIISDWFRTNAHYFDEIVCLDGSEGSATRDAAYATPNVIYMHERHLSLPYKTDHGLRAPMHRLLTGRHGFGHWITLCHADEFFYHDPRICCQRAEAEGWDSIAWYAVHFLPDPSELEQWPRLSALPPSERHRWYYWDYQGSGVPWIEFRSYRNSPQIHWEPSRHPSCTPIGAREHTAPFSPIFRHFKLASLNPSDYVRSADGVHFARRWQHVSYGRTGVPWSINEWKDLFVTHYEGYQRRGYFDGTFYESWNIGEEFRTSQPS